MTTARKVYPESPRKRATTSSSFMSNFSSGTNRRRGSRNTKGDHDNHRKEEEEEEEEVEQETGPYSSTLKYLTLVEPFPVEPPEYYTTLPRVSRPAFSDFQSKNESLPSYEPTVYKLAILYKKSEWISPFEMAQQRHWKPYIVELNSTQLNFYECPFKENDPIMKTFDASSSFSSTNSHSLLHPYHHHHLYLKRERGIKAPSAIGANSTYDYNYNEDNYRSIMTTKTDLKALKFLKSIDALEPTKIVRSFTLQYGKIGLAIDYTKKIDVFRCRFETEQFLLNFPSTEAMIEWYSALNLGMDNSLDLSRREMPNYRTVPRRRRRRLKNRYKSLQVSMGINLGVSYIHEIEQQPRKVASSIVSKVSDAGRNDNSKDNGFLNIFKKGGGLFGKNNSDKSTGSSRMDVKYDNNTIIKSSDDKDKPSFRKIGKRIGDGINGLSAQLSSTRVEDNYDDELDEELDGEGADDDDLDDIDMDDEDLIDDDEDEFPISENLNAGDDEHDSDVDIGGPAGSPDLSITLASVHSATDKTDTTILDSKVLQIPTNKNKIERIMSYQEYLAKPSPHSASAYTFQAQRKILRDSLRCMVPLIENERWANKHVLLDLTPKYQPQSDYNVEHHYQCFQVLTHIEGVGPKYVHKFKRPLQEWIVTPSGLIPHINPNYNR